jgi:hypothetical protein
VGVRLPRLARGIWNDLQEINFPCRILLATETISGLSVPNLYDKKFFLKTKTLIPIMLKTAQIEN